MKAHGENWGGVDTLTEGPQHSHQASDMPAHRWLCSLKVWQVFPYLWSVFPAPVLGMKAAVNLFLVTDGLTSFWGVVDVDLFSQPCDGFKNYFQASPTCSHC